ncbi:ACP S-malonyltransferase [Paenibacillus sp. Mc5Re-14]|uniref:ACP S-malonyltransferase n=1 Tax=Paenibacillus sp. Mc5Re-14 TaxID=1030529 RepID=UPI000A3EE69C|nr:ACP S-malonyltransferase [Paenibacillus sp. Mc5Re-14]
MKRKIVFMFSGQGSQYAHMGKELLARHQVFRSWMVRLDQVACSRLGSSVIEAIYAGRKGEKQNRTLYTHPAIFMVEYALFMTLLEEGVVPDYVLGASLGEFAAAAAAGVLAPDEALNLVIAQAEMLEVRCEPGGMMAILDNASLYRQEPMLHRNSTLAAVNFAGHFVVSGTNVALDHIAGMLSQKKIASERLPVSHAFHSSGIDSAAPLFCRLILKHTYRVPRIPLISCTSGSRVRVWPPTRLWDAVREPMLLPEAIRTLEAEQALAYLDLGPAGTLANLVKRNLGKESLSESCNILTPYGNDWNEFERVKRTYGGKNLISKIEVDQNMITYMFPGQGSQHKGMGGELFNEFREWTERADAILGYSIKALCLQDERQQLGHTQYTQPALYVVNALSYMKKRKEAGIVPDYVAGHSLGEYSALFAAGAFDFETGLKLVNKRGELMSKATGGGMAAIIGFTAEQVQDVLNRHFPNLSIANYNSPKQIVIAGMKADIEAAQPVFEAAGAHLYIPLNVSGAFHSKHMAEAEREFAAYLDLFTFSELNIPVISNVHARPYLQKDIKRNLMMQITRYVNWTDSIRYLMGRGDMRFEEIGPGNVLSKLAANISRDANPIVSVEETTTVMKNSAILSTGEMAASVQSKLASAPEIRREAAPEARRHRTDAGTQITAQSLGDEEFKRDYGLKYAYVTGSMYRGVASRTLVVQAAKAGLLSFYGAGGLDLEQIESDIRAMQRELDKGEAYGLNMLHQPMHPQKEEQLIDLYLRCGVKVIEASAYMAVNAPLVRYRAKGLVQDEDGSVTAGNRIMAKVSRPEVAEAFLSPAPERIVLRLLHENRITPAEADALRSIPMADDITVEADSGGHTDQGVAYTLLPTILRLRDELLQRYGYGKRVRVGAAGGIGTPEAAAAALLMGADYVVTGSINQCTTEAGTSDAVKDLLQQANVQDTEYAPAGDMFELGVKVQVLRKGLFFPARANKLYELYRKHASLDEIDEKNKRMIQDVYFNRTFGEVLEEIRTQWLPGEAAKAEINPKQQMALVFKWYFANSTKAALGGNPDQVVDYQIHCGPAMGAFNQWVKGTKLENWRNRHVDALGKLLMEQTAEMLNRQFLRFTNSSRQMEV